MTMESWGPVLVAACITRPTTARFDTSYLHSLSKTVADTAVLHVR